MEEKNQKEPESHRVNMYRTARIGADFLITTDHGDWLLLDKEAFAQLQRRDVGGEFAQILEKKGIIVTPRNEERLIEKTRKRYSYLFQAPTLHIVVPTMRCNSRCVYCHSSALGESSVDADMDEDTACRTVDFIMATPARSLHIEFQGGDALLNTKTLKNTVCYAKEKAVSAGKTVRFTIVTNLAAMTDEMLDWLWREKVEISTSLDGPKELHDKNRPGAGGYDNTVKWIKKIQEKYNRNPGVMMVTTRDSLTKAKEIIDTYANLGLDVVHVKPLSNIGRAAGEKGNAFGYTAEEFLAFWKECIEYIEKLNSQGVVIKERMHEIIKKKILTDEDPNYLELRSPCGMITGQLCYQYNGDLYTCDEGKAHELFRLGNVKTHTFRDVLNSAEAKKLISASINDCFLCDECAYKPYCGLCPAATYAETGDLIPDGCDYRCRINKGMFDYVFTKINEENKE